MEKLYITLKSQFTLEYLDCLNEYLDKNHLAVPLFQGTKNLII